MTREASQWVPAAWGRAAGVASGILAVLACAGSSEESANALPGSGDAGSASPFVVRARRGEVAAPSLDDVESMCALLTSCESLPIPRALVPSDFQACTKKMTEELTSPAAVSFSLTMRECGLTSSSCAGLRACALHGARADACRGRGGQGVVGFCDVEGRALTCWHDEVMAVRDCPRGGEQCVADDGRAKCTLGSCADVSGKARCSASGAHLVRCEKGKLVSLDCVAFGLGCTTAPDGTAGCATSGAVCDNVKRCEKDVAVTCLNGHEVKVDCSSGGLSCSGPPGAVPVGACVAPPPRTHACRPDDKPTCDGETIKYCNAGSSRSYSCKALGFRACESDKDGVRCGS